MDWKNIYYGQQEKPAPIVDEIVEYGSPVWDVVITCLFPDAVITSETFNLEGHFNISPKEAALTEKMGEKRKKEFIAGRSLVRQALKKFDLSNRPVLLGKDRAPIWPEGIVGSITHSGSYCGVALARKSEARGLGLDVEKIQSVNEGIYRFVLTPREQEKLKVLSPEEKERKVLFIFSAKESIYKCQYQISRQWLGFHAVEIDLDDAKEEFAAKFLVDGNGTYRKGEIWMGRYFSQSGYVFTGVFTPQQ